MAKRESREYCNVAECFCFNPAGYGGFIFGCVPNLEPRRTTVRCYSCGEPCCRGCRKRLHGQWYCINCWEIETGIEWDPRKAKNIPKEIRHKYIDDES